MRDVELYRHLLGLESPWTVRSVELNVAEERVDVWAHHPEGIRWPCPQCGAELGLYDHTEERVWRHPDSCQFLTYLHAQPPRVECPTHGIRQVRLPWAEARARFTSLFERLAIDVLKETDIRGATRILRISWDEAWHILERAVERGQRAKCPRVTPHLGVDEKAIAKGHQYLTLVCDLDRATVEFIAEDRKQASLAGYFTSLTADQLAGIAACQGRSPLSGKHRSRMSPVHRRSCPLTVIPRLPPPRGRRPAWACARAGPPSSSPAAGSCRP